MAVSDIPRPRSTPQILGGIINSLTSRLGIRRLRKGGPILSIAEATAQSQVKNSQDIFQLLQSRDLDNTTGIALDRIGADEDIPRFLVAKATGEVTVTDSSFEKIASKIFQGTGAPIVGSVEINVEDATDFTASGEVYIGRLTPNLEGPIAYSGKVNNGAYWTLTLSSPTTKFHNKGESVILAQGGVRTIDAGTTVATAQGAMVSAAQFATAFDAEIPDGETTVEGILVVANVAGAAGNAEPGAVVEFPGGAPFTGAEVTNPLPFVTGQDTELDDPYRDRVREKRNSRQKGTDLAITNAVLGIVAEDESRRCTSAALVRRRGEPSILFIDDGSGYEEAVAGVGIEVVTDAASGGEQVMRTLNRPVAKAHLVSANRAPFALSDSARLSIRVGGVVYTHTFDTSEFNAISAGSAYETVASINGNPSIEFSARTTSGGAGVVIFARDEANEDVEVVAAATGETDANDALQLPAGRRYTALLYRNDRLLSKDGSLAILRSNNTAVWNGFTGSQTLTIAVDGTPEVTYTFTDQDFVDGLTGFNGVGKNSAAAWVTVINAKIPGITAASEGDLISLTSNLGRSARSAVEITGGTLIAANVFVAGSAAGTASDYVLDRGTGDITLDDQAGTSDRYTLGTTWTRAFLETVSMASTDVASDVTLWFAVDGDTAMIAHGVGTSTALTATVLDMMAHGLRIKIDADSPGDPFENVEAGDWALLWDPDTELPDVMRSHWRVLEAPEVGGFKTRLVLEKRQACVPRMAHAAAALATPLVGQSSVLVCGGFSLDTQDSSDPGASRAGRAATDHAEIWVPGTATWTPTAHMAVARARHTATLLASGKVFVCGGFGIAGTALTSSELWDPTTGLWTAGPTLAVGRGDHTATMLASGRVLIAGGWNGTDLVAGATATSVEYNPGTSTFINAAVLNTARYGHVAVKLDVASTESNNVFVAGGRGAAGILASTEIYNAAAPAWTAKAAMNSPRAFFGAGSADVDKVVVIGDTDLAYATGAQTTWDRYDVSSDSWTGDDDISTIGGTEIFFADKSCAKTQDSGWIVALGAKAVTTGVAKMAHLIFDNDGSIDATPNVWVLIDDSTVWEHEVERCRHVAVPLTTTAGTDTVLLHGGTSVNSLADDEARGVTTATAALYNPNGDEPWSVPDDSVAMNETTLDNRGLTFVRTSGGLSRVVIPAATGYTAASYAAELNDVLDGATAATFRTSQLRVSTNSFGDTGDLTLVAASDATPPLPVAEVQTNLVGHMGSVPAGSSGLGTPDGWAIHHLMYEETAQTADAATTTWLADLDLIENPPQQPPNSSSSAVGLRRWTDGLNPRHWEAAYAVAADDVRVIEFGNALGFHSVVSDLTALGGSATRADRVRVGLRRAPQMELAPHQPTVFGLPYMFSATDDMTVVIDGDIDTKRFAVPAYRRMTPVESSFDGQIGLEDLDGGGTTVNRTFGSEFNFDDFAVHMKARVKSHSATAGKRILWRYYRHGAEGEFAQLRYMYPDAPLAAISTNVEHDQSTAVYDLDGLRRLSVDIILGSGAARSATVLNSQSKVGLARCNGNAGGVYDVYVMTGFALVEAERLVIGGTNRLRIQVPNNGVVAQGPQESGLQLGDLLWLEMASPSPTTLQSGVFAITAIDAFDTITGQQDVYFDGLNDGTSAYALTATPGTVSFDTTEETYWDVATTNGDLFRILGDDFADPYRLFTMRIAAHGRQYLRCRFPHFLADDATTPIWTTVVNPENLEIFVGPSQTATAVAAAVNALAGDTSTSPVTATVTGTGAGTISLASWDEADDANFGYQFTDGLNHVQRTIPGAGLGDDTQFLLKDPVSSDLATDSDWENEDVRLVPCSTANVVDWLNAPCVSGLFTAAEVRAAARGTTPQIATLTPGTAGSVEVQGGLANSATAAVFGAAHLVSHGDLGRDTMRATVRRAESAGFTAGAYVRADNTVALAKAAFWSSPDTVDEVGSDGTWTLSPTPYTLIGVVNNQRVHVEKYGPYVALHLPKLANSEVLQVNGGPSDEVAYIYVCAPTGTEVSSLEDVASANRGVFRIVAKSESYLAVTVWIENASAVEETSLAKIKTLAPDSAVPGDIWQVMTTQFGTRNRGAWTITEVGAVNVGDEMYTTDNFRVDTTTQAAEQIVSPIEFGDNPQVQLHEGVPSRVYARILSIAPNQDNGSYADIALDTAEGIARVSAAGGTVLTALDKLTFPSGVWLGVDGYGYDTGLLGLAAKVVYGDKDDEATYPGYAAHGADIVFAGPNVKRIQLALALRVQSGLEGDDLADRVRAAVAAVINRTPTSKPVSIGDIIAAAQQVTGVIAASPIRPSFTSTSDVIPVGAGEKARVLDIRGDISISFIGA